MFTQVFTTLITYPKEQEDMNKPEIIEEVARLSCIPLSLKMFFQNVASKRRNICYEREDFLVEKAVQKGERTVQRFSFCIYLPFLQVKSSSALRPALEWYDPADYTETSLKFWECTASSLTDTESHTIQYIRYINMLNIKLGLFIASSGTSQFYYFLLI